MADPDFASVVLLCHFDDTNGSTTFIDSSATPHTSFTPFSSTTISTTQSKFGGSSLTLPNSAQSLTVNDRISDFEFGAGQFTIECWAYYSGGGSTFPMLLSRYINSGGNGSWKFLLDPSGGNLYFQYTTDGTTAISVVGSYTPEAAWHHFAVDRDISNIIRTYVDGVVIASASAAATFFASTLGLTIGNDESVFNGFGGYIDEVRITKGIARYGGAFTPPTAAFDGSGASEEVTVTGNFFFQSEVMIAHTQTTSASGTITLSAITLSSAQVARNNCFCVFF